MARFAFVQQTRSKNKQEEKVVKKIAFMMAAAALVLTGMAGAQCSDPNNLLDGDLCGFDSPASVGPGNWVAPNSTFGSVAHSASGGRTTPGSLEGTPYIVGGPGGGSTLGAQYCLQNFPVANGDTFGFGAYVQVTTGAADCRVILTTYAAPDCTGGSVEETATPFIFGITSASGWVKLNDMMTLDATQAAGSMGIRVYCTDIFATPFLVSVDDAYVGPGMVPVELQAFSVE
jgi:hypothetical protein